MIKNAVESLYFDKCDIYEYEEITDPITHQTKQGENKVFENLPCRLVYKTITANSQQNGVATTSQVTELLLNPDYLVKDGCKIVVTKQTGQTVAYKSSGEPAYYPSHQEIMLELFERWSDNG